MTPGGSPDPRTDGQLFYDGTSTAGGTLPLPPLDWVDHPNAVTLGECDLHDHRPGGRRCQITRPHDTHPYGPMHPQGGLAHACIGVEPVTP